MTTSFITGGARSGKSRFAEQLAVERAGLGTICYVATGVAMDEEMEARITLHQSRRGSQFVTVEEPHDITSTLYQAEHDVYLVDCLSFLLNNWMYDLQYSESDYKQKVNELSECIRQTSAHVIVVSNEVGLGIVPMNTVSRLYRDWLGWLNQAVAKVTDEAYLVVAGCAVNLKQIPGARIVP